MVKRPRYHHTYWWVCRSSSKGFDVQPVEWVRHPGGWTGCQSIEQPRGGGIDPGDKDVFSNQADAVDECARRCLEEIAKLQQKIGTLTGTAQEMTALLENSARK